MVFIRSTLFALLASCQLILSAPAKQADAQDKASLRLIKTSEEDPGTWVTEDEKFELYTSKGIGFFDITDITDDEVLSILSSNTSSIERRAVVYPTSLSHTTEANALIATASTTGPQSWAKSLTDFHNRHYRSTYGTQASTWLFNQVKSVASVNSAIVVTQFSHSFNQPSIIARIPGQSAELVIVGAHFDSTAGSTTARSPGADDNASGSSVVLEALRVLASSGFKPENTLEFHFYAGEEGGLLGSQGIYANYKSAGKTVLAFLNQDMAGYSPNNKVAVYTDYVDSALTSYVRLIATQYTGATPSTSTCGYACSDHGSARSNGFPAAFVCEDVFASSNPYIHTANDSYDKIQWAAILRHTKLTLGFLVEASYL
ncbi:hypothetical protein AK830_g7701 [Neonectria ditissima]|uniref:Peptide hydrolase n=1 Tax=Neonectria ditissima TaxID=78410 RepID=A0A0P7AWH5_9HYPO|nr:hypothetical protein AK830_g7701 [Neonectria ditissima]